MKVRKRKDGRWVADLRYKGKGLRQSFDRKEDAQMFIDQHGQRMRRRRRTPGDRPTVKDFTDRLLVEQKGAVSRATYDILSTQLGHLCAFEVRKGLPAGSLRLEALDDDGDFVLGLLKWQKGRGYARDSVRLLRDKTKDLLDAAKSRGYIMEHPMHDVEVQKAVRGLFKQMRKAAPKIPKAMTEEQAALFLKTAEDQSRMFPFFAAGFGMGPRLGELVALQKVDDVHNWLTMPTTGERERVRQLHVCRQLEHRGSRKRPEPKGRKMDTGEGDSDYFVDVPGEVGDILDAHKRTLKASSPWLFQTRNGTPFGHSAVQKEFGRILKLAKLDDPEKYDFSPHSMRHTFATLHILNGDDPKWVSEQLGHADVTVTLRIYAKWFKQVRRGAANAHGVRLFGYRTACTAVNNGDGTANADGTEVARTTLSVDETPTPVLH